MAASSAMGDTRSSSSRTFSIRQSLSRPKNSAAATTSSSGPHPLPRPVEEEGLSVSPLASSTADSEQKKQKIKRPSPHRRSSSSSAKVPTSTTSSSSASTTGNGSASVEDVLSDGIRSTKQADLLIPMQPRITLSKFAKPSKTVMNDTSYQSGLGAAESTHLDAKNRTVSDTFVSFTRLPWKSPSVSRSSSPSSRDDKSSKDEDDSTVASSISSSSLPTRPPIAKTVSGVKDNVLPERPKLFRSPSSFSKKSRKPLSMLMKASVSDTSVPTSALEGSNSTIKPPIVNGSSNKKAVKDELWEAFKTLENDHQKFQSKSNLQKSSIIRQSVLPFLRKFRDIPSKVAPEILEKRVRTLHRWWTALLAQMKNRNPQAMTGTDRPLYIEAMSAMMSRPEWRCGPSSFAPLAQRTPSSAKSASTTSLSSASSDYSIQKSVQHNIKVLFTRTLYDTLAYIVEKMGLRSVPPVMVAFGGKVLAYAFYFCPGVAEMLISLWSLQPGMVRRVLPQFEVGRGTDLRGVSENIMSEFPETIQALGLTTLSATMRQLKKPAKAPVGVQIDWHGPWMGRWRGRDSDLLFVFLKYYHVLMCEYLPPDVSVTARLCAPGYVPVLAQILTLFENTIQRQPTPAGPESTASTTFEDLLNATATLPLPGRNTPRTMAENKVVVLIQDILSDKICSDFCRAIFFPSYVGMLKAAVEKTSLYDADACFQLVDLMEEVLPTLAAAERKEQRQYIDWNFWLAVLKTMSQSENNMTELRLISFLYTTWDLIVGEETRKRDICLDWLLSVTVWNRFFCHWCPMTRAYYMRLLCWRIGRYDGNANLLDLEIYKVMFIRLRTCYAHHLRLKGIAQQCNGPPSSTAPCLPAPSRRLVILRNDSMPTSQGVLLDGIVPTSVSFPTPQPLSRSSSANSLASLSESDPHDNSTPGGGQSSEPSTGRRWSSIRSVFSFKSAVSNGIAAGSPSPPASPSAVSASSMSSNESSTQEENQLQSRATFKFSLEWLDRPFFGSRERTLGPSRLAAPAQKYLDSSAVKIDEIKVSEQESQAKHWTYVGRALAEWVLVIMEHENFFERRKSEGRGTDRDVETPSLGVDSVRKF